jgi:hypothetical protein
MVKACANENKKNTSYCYITTPSTDDVNCCEESTVPDYLETWDFGNMDVHGTALILEDGRASVFPATSTGKHVVCCKTGMLRLIVDRRSYNRRCLN